MYPTDEIVSDFSVEADRARALIRVRMWGFFSVDDVLRYRRAIERISPTLGCPPSAQLMLNDVSDLVIQSQDVVAAFREASIDPRHSVRPVAFVVSSVLGRMQVARVMEGRNAQIFATAQEAESWLLGPARHAAGA